jgi:hypothetical protein
MISAEELFDQVPFELAARVQADDFFSDIPVVVAEKGNVRAEMDRLQAAITAKSGHRGAAVIVLPLLADDGYDEVAEGPMKLFASFQVLENVELNNDANGTKKSVRKIARRLVKIVKPLRLGGLTTDFVCDKPTIEAGVVKLANGSELQSRIVNFYTYEADTEPMLQVATPGFAQVGNQVGLSCVTDGAAIWFTLDETFPAPQSAVPGSTAQSYSEPLDVPEAGLVIRVCGYAAGMVASQVERAVIERSSD